jgi:hypothetical protein
MVTCGVRHWWRTAINRGGPNSEWHRWYPDRRGWNHQRHSRSGGAFDPGVVVDEPGARRALIRGIPDGTTEGSQVGTIKRKTRPRRHLGSREAGSEPVTATAVPLQGAAVAGLIWCSTDFDDPTRLSQRRVAFRRAKFAQAPRDHSMYAEPMCSLSTQSLVSILVSAQTKAQWRRRARECDERYPADSGYRRVVRLRRAAALGRSDRCIELLAGSHVRGLPRGKRSVLPTDPVYHGATAVMTSWLTFSPKETRVVAQRPAAPVVTAVGLAVRGWSKSGSSSPKRARQAWMYNDRPEAVAVIER